MNVPAKLEKPRVDNKFVSVDEYKLRGVGCDIASCITARYYKGIAANGDNVVIVVRDR